MYLETENAGDGTQIYLLRQHSYSCHKGNLAILFVKKAERSDINHSSIFNRPSSFQIVSYRQKRIYVRK